LIPIKRRIRTDAARLVAKLAKAFSFQAESAERPGNQLKGFSEKSFAFETPIGAAAVRGVYGCSAR
jgi:hypothetical protein